MGTHGLLFPFNQQFLLVESVCCVEIKFPISNSLDAAVLGFLTTLENDATLAASNGIFLGMGNTISGNGQVDGKVTADPGSVIEADGSLVLGDVTSIDGFSSNGELRTNEFTVTLRDLDTAVLRSHTTLGSGSGPGTLIAANGVSVNPGTTLRGIGTITGNITHQTGILSPGASAGILKIDGSYNQTSSGILEIEIEGTDDSDPLNPEFDALHVTGDATLDGTLNVSLLDGFVPSTPLPIFGGDGDSFTILTGDPVSGAFSEVTGLDYDNVARTGRVLMVDQTDNAVTLAAFQAAFGASPPAHEKSRRDRPAAGGVSGCGRGLGAVPSPPAAESHSNHADEGQD